MIVGPYLQMAAVVEVAFTNEHSCDGRFTGGRIHGGQQVTFELEEQLVAVAGRHQAL